MAPPRSHATTRAASAWLTEDAEHGARDTGVQQEEGLFVHGTNGARERMPQKWKKNCERLRGNAYKEAQLPELASRPLERHAKHVLVRVVLKTREAKTE